MPEISVKLWKHQQLMVNEALENMTHPSGGFHYWFADCGTGKTLAAIELMRRLHESVGVNFVLVLTIKAGLNSVWREDIETLTSGYVVHVLDKGTSKTKAKKLQDAKTKASTEIDKIHVVVVNYETARLLPIEEMGFDLVVADESHRLSSHNSKQSLVLAEKCAGIRYAVAMTGTAWADHLKQVYGQFRFLDPIVYNGNKHTGSKLFGHWKEFLHTYCNYYERDNIPIITGYKNVPDLIGTVSPYITRIKREDVIDLPPIHHIRRPFTLTKFLRTYYDQIKNEKVARIEDDVVMAQYEMTLRHRLHQLTRGWYVSYPEEEVTRLQGSGSDLAVQTTVDLLEELGSEPVVIFTSYKEDVRILDEAIHKKNKVHPTLLTGDVDQHELFMQGKSDILIANLQAGSTGVRLHRARYVIFYGLSPSTARTNYLQAIDRVHRKGVEGTVHVYYIVGEDTIDEDAYKLLSSKEARDLKGQALL